MRKLNVSQFFVCSAFKIFEIRKMYFWKLPPDDVTKGTFSLLTIVCCLLYQRDRLCFYQFSKQWGGSGLCCCFDAKKIKKIKCFALSMS